MSKNFNKVFLSIISVFFILLIGFLLTLFDSNVIMLKAYYSSDISYSGNALFLDPNDYYQDNFINYNYFYAENVTIDYLDDGLRIYNMTSDYGSATYNLNAYKGQTITIKVFDVDTTSGHPYIAYWNGNNVFVDDLYDGYQKTFIVTNTEYNNLSINPNRGSTTGDIEVFRIMGVVGDTTIEDYHKHYMFGYIVQSNDTNDFVMTFRDNYDSNNVYTLQGYSKLYLPFQYINNNMVTLSYNINGYSISGSAIRSNIFYYPIFSGTNISSNNDNMISNLAYTYNYMYYSNFTIIPTDNVCTTDGLIDFTYFSNNYDSNEYLVNVSDYSYCTYRNNIITDFNSTINQSHIIDYHPYFNYSKPIYSFKINTLFLPINYSYYYNMSFDSIVFGVKNEQIGGAIPINNDGTREIYNSCGNFVTDFNCYAGNAVTYIIYNVPVIGPVLSFVSSVFVFSDSTITILNSFSSFGVIFSCFILCLFIYILKKLYGGD